MKTIGFKDIPQGWIMATREGLLHGKRNAGAAIICLALLVFEKESRDQARTRYRRQLLTDEGAPRCDRVFVFSDESAPQHRRNFKGAVRLLADLGYITAFEDTPSDGGCAIHGLILSDGPLDPAAVTDLEWQLFLGAEQLGRSRLMAS